ncbi:MAG: glycoside hydrolase family 127 protein [Oscillospiraceae bacterium]
MLKAVDKRQVSVLPGLFRERMELNRTYLMELDTTCLLQNFYLEAGIIIPGIQVIDHPETVKLHWGWEAPTCQLRGHFLGHWLAAAASYIANDNDTQLKAKLDIIVAELARCQQLNGGEWVGSIPEKYFARLATGEYIWSPQYTMHKTILGLMKAYTDAGNAQALDILDRLAGWYLRWTDEMAKHNPHAVYSGEEAGMLEVWASLYEITCAEKYLTLAKRYQDAGLFRNLTDGKDALTNCHANASIPLSHGAAKLYEITGDDAWRVVTERFWENAVTARGKFATTGQNAGEFWVPPFLQGQYFGDMNQEFCTVYNMVRTADYLYRRTGETVYADYIEKCLYNGFLAQQNKDTGMPAYFLPLTAGSRKKWGSKTHDFWCCHGTMVQAQALYPELIYFTGEAENKLTVSQYIPSSVRVKSGEAELFVEQVTGMKYYNDQAFFDERDTSQMSRWFVKFKVNASSAELYTLSFRVPGWVSAPPTLLLNGQEITAQPEGSYLSLTRAWHNDTLDLFFPSAVKAEPIPGEPELAAFVDGPIVLAGLTDADRGLTGDFSAPKTFLIPQIEHIYGTFPWKQNCYRTRRQAQNFTFKPLYEITDETYTVYFTQKD